MVRTPPPIVILGTGRSFTSVISCMLGQHPTRIGLPETNIFCDATLGELMDRFNQKTSRFRRAGLLRTLAQYHDGAQTEETIDAAQAWIDARRDWSSRQIADYIRDLVGPQGIVEKSISTARLPVTLTRALEAWPDALFLHLTRQPESIVNSMQSRLEAKMDSKGSGRKFDYLRANTGLDGYFNRLTCSILRFMAQLPPGRAMNLCGEDFLSDAKLYLPQICEWAGLDASPAALDAMLHPERNPFAFLGPRNAEGGMSRSFMDHPEYSGKAVKIDLMSARPDDMSNSPDTQKMARLGHRLGYASA